MKKRKLARPARTPRTPRGKDGKAVTAYLDPLVARFVPEARIHECIKDHQRGVCTPIAWPGLTEPVQKTTCIHQNFEWWVVSFPRQRRLFIGPPAFFSQFFPGGSAAGQ